jgi:hypothetical protein
MIKQLLIAFDQFINALFGGWADETISSRCWRLRHKPVYNLLRRVIDGVPFFGKDHCKNAYLSEIKRLQSPLSQRRPLEEER